MPLSNVQLDTLSKICGWTIQNSSLFDEAFAHPAGPAGNPRKYTKSYERLEFLGDRILGFVVGEALFKYFKAESEGKITKRYIALVRKETLVIVSKKLDLGSFITQLPDNDDHLRTGATALADVMEAFIAALYLDAGFEVVRKFILSHWSPLMQAQEDPPSDAKSILQELLQAKNLPLPTYTVIETTGPSNAPVFAVEITGKGFDPRRAEGTTKKMAEHKAAQMVLDEFEGKK